MVYISFVQPLNGVQSLCTNKKWFTVPLYKQEMVYSPFVQQINGELSLCTTIKWCTIPAIKWCPSLTRNYVQSLFTTVKWCTVPLYNQ